MGSALVTGASVGIGREIAKQLADLGYDLIISARRTAELEELADDIRRRNDVAVTVVPADLRLSPDVDRVVSAAAEAAELTVLVNNAGFGYYGEFFSADASLYESMIGVNVTALTRLCRELIPPMVHRRAGRVLNVASVAAFQPGPRMAVYYATKAYVLSLSEALSRELAGTGVTVTTLCPGPTRSEFHSRAGIATPEAPSGRGGGDKDRGGGQRDGSGRRGRGRGGRGNAMAHSRMPDSRTVAAYGIKAMMRGRRVAVHGLLYKLSIFAERFLPRRLVVNAIYHLQSSRSDR